MNYPISKNSGAATLILIKVRFGHLCTRPTKPQDIVLRQAKKMERKFLQLNMIRNAYNSKKKKKNDPEWPELAVP